MKTPGDTRRIMDALEGQHPGADTELHYRTPFELLVATILSAQSTDARVNLVTPALFKRYSTAKHFARATTKALEPQIEACGAVVTRQGLRIAVDAREAARGLVDRLPTAEFGVAFTYPPPAVGI